MVEKKINVLVITGVPDTGNVKLIPSGDKYSFGFEGAEDFTSYLYKYGVFNIVKKIIVPTAKQKLPNPKKFDLVVNAICDPDSNRKALNIASNILRYRFPPVVNHPLKIFNTSRDNVYRLLKGTDGLVTPRVWKFSPKKLTDIKKFIERENIQYPFLFRPAGTHTGHGLIKIENEKQLEELERFPFDGSEYYIIEFYDFRSEDGLYRKYRIFFVDKKMYPRHLIVSSNWNIHVRNATEFMTKEPYKTERKNFIENFATEKFKPLSLIPEKFGLDYFMVDFGISREGKFVIFEVNSCGKLLTAENKFSPEPHVKRIIEAIKEMLIKKVNRV